MTPELQKKLEYCVRDSNASVRTVLLRYCALPNIFFNNESITKLLVVVGV